MPNLIMLVGAPGAGKTTFRNDMLDSCIIISSDDYIMQRARQLDKQYHEVFKQELPDAEKHIKDLFGKAVINKNDVIIDRTNMTAKSRRKWLSKVSSDYYKTVYVFIDDPHIIIERSHTRKDKVVGADIVRGMLDRYEPIDKAEGFDRIIEVRTQSAKYQWQLGVLK